MRKRVRCISSLATIFLLLALLSFLYIWTSSEVPAPPQTPQAKQEKTAPARPSPRVLTPPPHAPAKRTMMPPAASEPKRVQVRTRRPADIPPPADPALMSWRGCERLEFARRGDTRMVFTARAIPSEAVHDEPCWEIPSGFIVYQFRIDSDGAYRHYWSNGFAFDEFPGDEAHVGDGLIRPAFRLQSLGPASVKVTLIARPK